MQPSALQILYFGLALLAVAIIVLIRETFKRRRLLNQTSAELAARLDELAPLDPLSSKVQPIDGQYSRRRAESRIWAAAKPISVVPTSSTIVEPISPPLAPRSEPAESKLEESEPDASKPEEGTCTALILPPVTVDALLWERLLAVPTEAEIRAVTARMPEPAPPPSVETRFEVVATSGPLTTPAVPKTSDTPTGMIEEPALRDLLARTRLFTGLVVSIGLNEPEDGMWRGEGLYQSIANFVASVLGPNDFGCRTAIDEFLVVVPGKTESDAQNHLNLIADRLWDFQLRGIGACAILFSWGGATANGQLLSGAITSATQRMRQAKQRRNPPPVRLLGYRHAN